METISVEKLAEMLGIFTHGRWIKCTNHYWGDRYKCSKCGHDTEVDTMMGKPIYKFCPYCGAKMDEERREE